MIQSLTKFKSPLRPERQGWLSKTTRVKWQISKTQIVYPPISKPTERHQGLYSLLPWPLLFLAVVLHVYPKPVPWVILCPVMHVDNWFGPRRRSSQRGPPPECPAPIYLPGWAGARSSPLLSSLDQGSVQVFLQSVLYRFSQTPVSHPPATR